MSRALPGPVLRTAHHLHGGFSLVRHLEDGHLPGVLDATAADGEAWDVVIVQDHSRLGVPYADESAGTIGDRAPFFEGAAGVAEMVSDIGAKMVFYMTWAKEDFPGQTEALARRMRRPVIGMTRMSRRSGWPGIEFARNDRISSCSTRTDRIRPLPGPTSTRRSSTRSSRVRPPMGAPAELHRHRDAHAWRGGQR